MGTKHGLNPGGAAKLFLRESRVFDMDPF